MTLAEVIGLIVSLVIFVRVVKAFMGPRRRE